MIHDPYLVPPLPPTWPYQPGMPLRPLGCRLNLELPGFGGGWRVCTPGGMVPEGEASVLAGAYGRGGVVRVGDLVLRPYRRGGLLRHVNERTYRSHLRFAAEHAVHRGLWESGFPTVEPLGYAWRPVRMGVEGVLITRLAEGEPWPGRWDLSHDRASVIREGISHLPHGPTATFSLHNVVLRHDLPDAVRGSVSEAYPHLIFEGFTTKLGMRCVSILKNLFPAGDGKKGSRVITFRRTEGDYISVRHHVFVRTAHDQVELAEVGPRMEMKVSPKIYLRGGVEGPDADVVMWGGVVVRNQARDGGE